MQLDPPSGVNDLTMCPVLDFANYAAAQTAVPEFVPRGSTQRGAKAWAWPAPEGQALKEGDQSSPFPSHPVLTRKAD